MPTLDEIVRQIENLDGAQHIKKLNIHKREDVKELPGILQDDEKIEKFAGGFYDNRTGVIVATDQRFLFIYKTVFSGVKVKDYPYERINSVEYNQGLIYGGLQLFFKDYLIEIKSIDKTLVKGIFDYIRSKIGSAEGRETTVEELGKNMVSPTLDEIERQIKNLDKRKQILKRKEIKELPGILRNNEKIESIASGEYDESYGIIVVTDKRFLYISKSMFSGVKVKDYPYDSIDSVLLDKNKIYFPGLPGAELCIISQGNVAAVITKIPLNLAQGIFDSIQSKINSSEEK
ncbi:MAG: PH domain-containing protein [Candidatus Lokiarchaeota archaeon]|nr:PH domain-containing protein [Candidatus Lokiarchaeota archaeon]